jgi:hypothetical protein
MRSGRQPSPAALARVRRAIRRETADWWFPVIRCSQCPRKVEFQFRESLDCPEIIKVTFTCRCGARDVRRYNRFNAVVARACSEGRRELVLGVDL